MGRHSWVIVLGSSLLAACAAEAPPRPAPEAPAAGAEASEELAWPTYAGAWFEVDYPPGFRVRPSLPSTTAEGYDSVFFESPDGRVSFYVCSPQWSREPSDIEPAEASETVVAAEEEGIPAGTIRRYAIAALDGSYLREYEERELFEGSVRWAVGFRYPDPRTREEYGHSYERFKESLRQFSD